MAVVIWLVVGFVVGAVFVVGLAASMMSSEISRREEGYEDYRDC